MKSGNLNFLEPSGPLQACNGTALPLPIIKRVLSPPSRMLGLSIYVTAEVTTLLGSRCHLVKMLNLQHYWRDYTLITNLMHWLLFIHKILFSSTCFNLFIKYYSPLHISSIKCSSSGGHSCIQATYGTVTL